MNRFRYIEKKELCSYDLSEEFFYELGVNIDDIIPLRKVFVLFTDKGKKILKSTSSSEDRIKFIEKALNFIRKEDNCVLQYSHNSKDEVITKWKDKSYVLLDMIDGREANFSNPVEIEWCSKALAKFHIASKNINNEFNIDEIEKYTGKNLIYEYINDFCIISEMERVINKFIYKNTFDMLFLKEVKKAKADLENSINLLINTNYNKLYKEKDKKVLCHLDLAHHNFIINEENINLIDFDYCALDMRVIDIYNFLTKVIKTLYYSQSSVELVLNNYNSISEISDDEKSILFALLNAPKDFITISKDYYLKRKSWDEEVFVSRLFNKIELDDFREELISNYNFK